MEAALAEGFTFVAMARALLREPDLPNRMQAGTSTTSLCIRCNSAVHDLLGHTLCPGDGPSGVGDRPGSA